jgi:transcriptional regulator with XRE-family HTH domain
MKYSFLKELLEEKRINIPALANEIGMSKAGLYQAIDKERLTVDTLEKIANALSVPVSVFFTNGTMNDPDAIQKELVTALKELSELNAKYENIVKINSLNEKLVESITKAATANERVFYILSSELQSLRRLAQPHIRNSVLLDHPEIKKPDFEDSKLLHKYINTDSLNKKFSSTMNMIEELLKPNLIKFTYDNEQNENQNEIQ